MNRLLRRAGFQRRKTQVDQDVRPSSPSSRSDYLLTHDQACFELYGQFSTTSGTVKDQDPILVAYFPGFERSFVSESFLKSIRNQPQPLSYEYSSNNQVKLFWELENIKKKRKGKPYRFSMQFTVVPQDLRCGVILGGHHSTWPRSDENPDILRNSSRNGHSSHRYSRTPKIVSKLFSKAGHSEKSRHVSVKLPKVVLIKRSDLQAEIGPEERLSAQSTPVSTFQSRFTNLQPSRSSINEHQASNPRIIADNPWIPSQTQQYSYDPSDIYSDPPQYSTIQLSPFLHSHSYSHHILTHSTTTTTSTVCKRDSAITESFDPQLPNHENGTLNSALNSGISRIQRAEPRRSSYRTIQQQADFSPIEEVPSHSLSIPRPSSENASNLDHSSTQLPGTNNTDLYTASSTAPEKSQNLHESAQRLPIPQNTISPLSPSPEENPRTPVNKIARRIGDIQISKRATTTAEELAATRANDPHWTWDEDTQRYYRLHAQTKKVVWFGEGT